jgi:molecular chaperone GrpE
MNDSDPRPTENEATPAPEATTQPEAPAAAAPKPSTSLDRELADMKDRLLRALADMENMRKRTEREVADARAYGISNFARDIIGVADNMHRAMQALDDELRAKADEATKTLLEGVELTERELMKTLEKHGVKRVEPMGQKFDPNKHQAMYEVEDASVPSGSVVQVMQGGYMIGERVLRPALVAVSKGGAKPAPSGQEDRAKASPADDNAAGP